jgi:hypothetical protein
VEIFGMGRIDFFELEERVDVRLDAAIFSLGWSCWFR